MLRLSIILSLLCLPVLLQAAPEVRLNSTKYADDPRLERIVSDMPEIAATAVARLKASLGVSGPLELVDIEIQDIANRRSATRALAREITRDGQTRQQVVLYAEHLVIAPHDAPVLLAHELKHALFRARMGAAYDALPVWVREGLAVYGAGQLEDRVALVVGAAVFAGRDPHSLPRLPGTHRHTAWDYPTSAAAFAWLAERADVPEFCAALLAGEDALEAFGRAAGLEPVAALEGALEYARALVGRVFGAAGAEFVRLRNADNAQELERWLAEHAGHALYANALFRAGRAHVRAGNFVRGRELLGQVAGLHHRSVLADDAMHWLVRSHELKGEEAEQASARAALERDYSWSRHAR